MLTMGCIMSIGTMLAWMYPTMSKRDPSLPPKPFFIDAGGGPGHVALILPAYLGWFTISSEIFHSKFILLSNMEKIVT